MGNFSARVETLNLKKKCQTQWVCLILNRGRLLTGARENYGWALAREISTRDFISGMLTIKERAGGLP